MPATPRAAASRVTRPDRRFGRDELASLEREQRRKLVQVLLNDTGAHLIEFQSTGAHDEFVLEMPLLWRARRVRVRVAAEPVDTSSLARLAEAIRVSGDAEGIMLAPCGAPEPLTIPAEVQLLMPEEIIGRLERSASITWVDGTPRPASDRLELQRDLDRDAFLLDPVGLRWLPTLALHELPAEVAANVAAEDLFERVAFRLLTSSLRFEGERFGEAARGQRLPDAVLRCPGPDGPGVLLDCKATSSGYTMASDHLLRFSEYATALRDQVEEEGFSLRYMLVISSLFPGTPGAGHPFHGRARALRRRAGLQLVYLRAEDLARAATSVEMRGLSTKARSRLNWSAVFDHGLVTTEHLSEMLEASN